MAITDEHQTTESADARWVVGHDGSKGAAQAVRWCLAHAPQRLQSVEIVRAWQLPAVDVPWSRDTIADMEPSAVCSDLADLVEQFASAGIDLASRVVQGGASRVLLEASDDAELLVVGSRGLGGFGRLLLGSVSSQCAAHARRPTVDVPTNAPVADPVRRVVVGVDGSEGSRAALMWALDFAPDGATIHVVGAWRPSHSAAVATVQFHSHELRQTRQQFHDLVDSIGPEVVGEHQLERDFIKTDPTRALLDASARADLVVVGQRGHSGLSAVILGSVSTHVLHHSTIPIAIIPNPSPR